jgi:membrane-bound ClpP family serine protease
MMMLLAQVAADTDPNEAYLLWGGLLLAAAIGLLALEFFVPSGGIIGILCAICAVGSAVSFFRYDRTLGFAMAALYIVGTPILLFFLFKVWINSPLAKRMILTSGVTDTDQADDVENEEAPATSAMQRKSRHEQMRELIGASGTAETPLSKPTTSPAATS